MSPLLAPAGSQPQFPHALAAGVKTMYGGVKSFSALFKISFPAAFRLIREKLPLSRLVTLNSGSRSSGGQKPMGKGSSAISALGA